MAGKRYTPAEEDRIRRGYLMLEPLASIAAAIGKSEATIRQKAKRMGLSNEAHQKRCAREQMRQRHAEEGVTATLHAAAQSEQARAKRTASLKRRWADPAFRAMATHRRRKAWDERRGFSIPASLRSDYDRMISQKFTAAEAGQMLGLITPDQRSA